MFTRTAHQATAFSLAAALTLAILSSINLLAMQPSEPGLMAAGPAASQVVVIVGKRATRS